MILLAACDPHFLLESSERLWNIVFIMRLYFWARIRVRETRCAPPEMSELICGDRGGRLAATWPTYRLSIIRSGALSDCFFFLEGLWGVLSS